MADGGSSSPTRQLWKYDVFLSFRGEDTRRRFTDHLYHALVGAGVNTFRDGEDLRRGDAIATELARSIRESRIAVVVFSDGYADSRWCLEEIAEIMECRKADRLLVLPVFYEVDPADVRKQKGRFAAAFEKHADRFGVDSVDVRRWRAALTEAANLSGWDLRQFADGHEGKFIKKIVERIQMELKVTYLEVAIYPVGIELRLQRLSSLMAVVSDNPSSTLFLGIYGMSGIGKTTLSKALFNKFFHSFPSRSFLPNINHTATASSDGLLRLQRALLSDLLTATKLRSECIATADSAVVQIQQRLRMKKVLVILDDVDRIEQVNALARERAWFGVGSRIVITTRNKHVLDTLQVDEVYNAESDPLDEDESLELFSYHAFREPHPPPEFLDHAKSVVSYCRHLPLALEVLGGSFFGGRGIAEWKSAIERLKRIPHEDLQEKLEIGYEQLKGETEREIFLDVCCYFVGMGRELVVRILDGCGVFGEIGLGVLKSRCLVGFDIVSGRLKMHDLVRDMGREIVRRSCVKEPGCRSRIWAHHEVLKVLANQTGTENIEGVALELAKSNKEKLKVEAFRKMHNLRLLKLNYVKLMGKFEHLMSKELRWICWHGFPYKFIPSNFYQGNLVVIDMRYSSLIQPWTWRDSQSLENLKVLNLSHSKNLKKSPNFTKVPNLEQLKLKNCIALSSLHPSIGQLDKLLLINLQNCTNLSSLPTSIYKINSLQTLIISGCSKIDRLHDDLGCLDSLTTLLADRTAISYIPFSIVRLKNLTDLSLCGCNSKGARRSVAWQLASWAMSKPNQTSRSLILPCSLNGLRSLTDLSLENCNLESIPMDIGSLSELHKLSVGGNKNLRALGNGLCGLLKLRELSVANCTSLESIHGFPKNLMIFIATNCKSLVNTPDVSLLHKPPNLILTNCCRLVEVCGLDKLDCSSNVRMAGCFNLSTPFRMSLLKKWSGDGIGSLCVVGNQVPKCLHFYTSHPPLTFQLPILNSTFLGFTIFALYTRLITDLNDSPSLQLVNKTTSRTHRYRMLGLHRHHPINIHAHHTWAIHLPLSYGYRVDAGDEIELHIPNANAYGVRLVYRDEDEPDQVIENSSLPLMGEDRGGGDDDGDVDNSRYQCLDQQLQERDSNSSPILFIKYFFMISVLVLCLSLVLMFKW